MIRILVSTITLILILAPLHGQDLELRELVRNHLRAVGKIDAYQKLNSYSVRGTIEQGGSTATFTIYKRGGAMRCEIETNHKDGKTIILYDGRNAWQWQQNNPQNLSPASPETTAWIASEARFLPLLANYQNEGYRAQILGLTQIPESDDMVYQIRLRHPNDVSETDIFLDSITLLELRRDYSPGPGSPVLETLFQDYRPVEGFLTPHSITNRLDGQILSRVTLSSVTLNIGIPRYFFEPPVTP